MLQIQEHVPLAPLTTLRIGGAAGYYIRIEDREALLEALSFSRSHSLSSFVLGGGSNLLVSDNGFPGLVIHLALPPAILRTDEGDAILFEVSAGTDWDAMVLEMCQQGISGMECLAGIPGLTGASPIQNIGAYGQEVAQTIDRVTALDLNSLTFVDLPAAACRFAYRQSIFNSTERGRYIITSVRFRLLAAATPNLTYADLAPLRVAPGGPPTPLDVYHFVRSIRARKGMLIDPSASTPDTRSAGSFFKNPRVPSTALAPIAEALALPITAIPHWPTSSGDLKLPAAWLIERAGFPKGFTLGPVGISTRHTLALTNRTGAATCADLIHLRDTIAAEVNHRFGIRLEQEPVFLS